jgi:hypothetical protein
MLGVFYARYDQTLHVAIVLLQVVQRAVLHHRVVGVSLCSGGTPYMRDCYFAD